MVLDKSGHLCVLYFHVFHLDYVWQNQYSIVKQNKVKIKIKK